MKKTVLFLSCLVVAALFFIEFQIFNLDIKVLVNEPENQIINNTGTLLDSSKNWNDYTSVELESIVESDIELTLADLDDIIIILKERAKAKHSIVRISSTKDKDKGSN